MRAQPVRGERHRRGNEADQTGTGNAPGLPLGRTDTSKTLSARNAVRAQFSDDSLSAWGDPPSPGGGYAERGVNLERMKAGLGAKAKVQRKKA
jgi:hypothetical protein